MSCHYMIWDRDAETEATQRGGKNGNIPLTVAIHGSIRACGADSGASGLCPEHAAFVADATSATVSKLDMKYPYREPRRKAAKPGPSRVVETILPPEAEGKELRLDFERATGSAKQKALAALLAYQNKRALEINEWRRSTSQACAPGFAPDPIDHTLAETITAQVCPNAKARPEIREPAYEKIHVFPLPGDYIAEIHAPTETDRASAKKAVDFIAEHILVGTVPAFASARTIPSSDSPAYTKERAAMMDRMADRADPTAATVYGFRFEYRAEGGSGFYWNGKRVASTKEGLERMGLAILAKVCK